MPQVWPKCLAVVICDAIWRDPATHKRTILGTFSGIGMLDFPATHPQMAVYVSLTSGHGTMDVRLAVVPTDLTRPPLFETTVPITFKDPREVLEFDFHLRNVVYPEPGSYRVQVHAGDELLVERRFLVSKAPGSRKRPTRDDQPNN